MVLLITRALRFRYIWMGSLCIVQDRSSDWEAEAKKMGGLLSQRVSDNSRRVGSFGR